MKNAASYHPGLVMPSTTNKAPLTTPQLLLHLLPRSNECLPELVSDQSGLAMPL